METEMELGAKNGAKTDSQYISNLGLGLVVRLDSANSVFAAENGDCYKLR